MHSDVIIAYSNMSNTIYEHSNNSHFAWAPQLAPKCCTVICYRHSSQRHGQGRLTFTNGDVYSGKFDHDMITGEGEMTYKNGGRYNGAWRNGKVTRCGIMISLLLWYNI